MARPTVVTPEKIEAVCSRIEVGSTLNAACAAEGISVRAWLRFMDANEEAAREYSIALKARAEHFEAEHDRIAATAKDKDSAAAARVQLNALEWKMSKLAPSRYGERLDVAVEHKVSLADVMERRRRKLLEENERLGLPGPEDEA